LLKYLPDDSNDDIPPENPLAYSLFWKNPKFFITNVSLMITLAGNLFLLTGIIFGIENYPGIEDQEVHLITFYTTVYGICMYVLS
jgi:hypothetical protein